MILDEAISSVDTRTEKLIQKAMDNLIEGKPVSLSPIDCQLSEMQTILS